jgi:hypothetical protein
VTVNGGSPASVSCPAGTSTLAVLAASMSPGTWAELSTTNVGVLLSANTGGGGVGGNNIPYANKMSWNPFSRRMVFIGRDHGSTVPYEPDIAYDEVTNTWSASNSGLNINSFSHGNDCNVVRPDTGDHYFRGNGGGVATEPVVRKPYGGSWGTFNTAGSTSYTQIFVGSAWWPGSSTGNTALAGKGAAGCWCICEIALGSMTLYDPIANTWEVLTVPATNPPTDVYHSVAAYSPVYNCMVYGGGNNGSNSSTSQWMFRLNQNKTVTRLADCPIGFGIQRANLQVDPRTGKFLIWGNGRNFYELDPSGSGTYTKLTGTRLPPAAGLHGVSDPSSGAGGPDALVSCSLPDHGVIAYMSASGASYSNIFLYRHA